METVIFIQVSFLLGLCSDKKTHFFTQKEIFWNIGNIMGWDLDRKISEVIEKGLENMSCNKYREFFLYYCYEIYYPDKVNWAWVSIFLTRTFIFLRE